MNEATGLAPAAGRLLVATPLLGDPHFVRTVVQLLRVDEDGVLGIVINRTVGSADPSGGLDLDEVVPEWARIAAPPRVLFAGGPVGADSALGLAQLTAPVPGDGFLPLVPGPPALGTVDLDADPATLGPLSGVRVFAGYAGWSEGQLEAEIAEGAWWVVEGLPGDAFTADPARLWSRVVRRQGAGFWLVATWPADAGAN